MTSRLLQSLSITSLVVIALGAVAVRSTAAAPFLLVGSDGGVGATTE
jgi:hypothetical protein